MSEIAIQDPSGLTAQMEYAKTVASASMLPDNYRGKPADIMLAVGLGQSMGLSPAESLYRISVIKGKPTASAELIASNVRRAGHKLRIRGDESSATATIVRADDPDFEFTAVRDLAWAERMGLAKNDNYRKQAGTMLRWRAITAVAREACPEALYGVAYTPDELGDSPDRPQQVAPTQGNADRLRGALDYEAEGESQQGHVETMLNTSSSLAKRMFALMGESGITQRDDRLLYVSDTIGREVTSSTDMTEDDARAVIASLEKDADVAGESA